MFRAFIILLFGFLFLSVLMSCSSDFSDRDDQGPLKCPADMRIAHYRISDSVKAFFPYGPDTNQLIFVDSAGDRQVSERVSLTSTGKYTICQRELCRTDRRNRESKTCETISSDSLFASFESTNPNLTFQYFVGIQLTFEDHGGNYNPIYEGIDIDFPKVHNSGAPDFFYMRCINCDQAIEDTLSTQYQSMFYEIIRGATGYSSATVPVCFQGFSHP